MEELKPNKLQKILKDFMEQKELVTGEELLIQL